MTISHAIAIHHRDLTRSTLARLQIALDPRTATDFRDRVGHQRLAIVDTAARAGLANDSTLDIGRVISS